MPKFGEAGAEAIPSTEARSLRVMPSRSHGLRVEKRCRRLISNRRRRGSAAVLRAGDAAGFPAVARDGHQFQNRSEKEALLLEIGSRRPAEDVSGYPDVGVIVEPLKLGPYADGTPSE